MWEARLNNKDVDWRQLDTKGPGGIDETMAMVEEPDYKIYAPIGKKIIEGRFPHLKSYLEDSDDEWYVMIPIETNY